MVADHDRAGYYQVGSVRTYSKIESVELHRRFNIHPEWRFNDLAFGGYDWTVEPKETLGELYQRRCRQLREKYDKIVIFYSGGIDSQNIIDHFVAAGCRIDEIATTEYSIDTDPMSQFNCEQTMVSFPYMERLRAKGVHFLHRRIDLTEMAWEIIHDRSLLSDYIFYCNSGFGLNRLAKAKVREHIKDYRDWIDQGKTVGFIYGVDKPKLYIEDGRFCLRFLDLVIDIACSPYTQIKGHPLQFDELFYWSPDCMDLLCKQAHVVRKFLRNTGLDSFFSPGVTDTPSLRQAIQKLPTMQGRRLLEWRDVINSLIYDQYDPMMYDGKIKTPAIYSGREACWLKDPSVRDPYLDVLKYFEKIDSYWYTDPKEYYKGLKGCLSPCYWLESPLNHAVDQ